jgi:hypothetical protein
MPTLNKTSEPHEQQLQTRRQPKLQSQCGKDLGNRYGHKRKKKGFTHSARSQSSACEAATNETLAIAGLDAAA